MVERIQFTSVVIRGVPYFLSVSILFVPVLSFSQVTFERTYGGPYDDWGESVQETQDGGYILGGWTTDGPTLRMSVVKTDSLGNSLWLKTYGGTGREMCHAIQQTTDQGYFILGETVAYGAGGSDFYLIKTDSLGNTLWTRTYGGSNDERGFSFKKTQDGGYIILGWTQSFGAGFWDVYLIKTNSSWDTVWTKTYGGNLDDVGNSVQETQNGGYILAGFTQSFGSGDEDFYLIKTNSSGETLWTKTYGGILEEWCYSVQETQDGGYLLAGHTKSFGAGDWDIYLVKTDSFGNPLWTRTYGGSGEDRCHSLERTQDGGYILAGWTRSFGAGGNDIYLIKTDSLGNTLWTRTYGGTDFDWGLSVQQTSDGGYIVGGAGDRNSSLTNSDLYLLKTDGDGLIERDGGVLTLDSPGDSVFTDSTYPVIATVKNFGKAFLTFDVNATIRGYFDVQQVTDLPPDSSIQVTFINWQVPPIETTYTMTVCTQVSEDRDTTNDCQSRTILALTPVGIPEEPSDFPTMTTLYPAIPNPVFRTTLLRYSLAHAGHATLKIYDLTGRLLETLVDGYQKPGVYQLPITHRQLPSSGVYFYRLMTQSGQIATRKLILLK